MNSASTIGLLMLLTLAPAMAEGAPNSARKDAQRIPGQPFERYFTTDTFGREIAFYISEEPDNAPAMPLVVYVHGSGSQSLFGKRGDQIVPQNGQGTIADVVRGKARLLVVEKPGVKYLDTPQNAGGATNASGEFLNEHTLDRWAEAVSAAIRAARTLRAIDANRVLVIGHSEGGLVACRVAAENDFVTHVACLAGGGPTQLFDLVELAREGKFAGPVSDDPEVRVQFIYDQYASVVADPQSTTMQFMGHPHRRWSSFLASSPMQELSRTKAKVYIAQGGKDRSVHPISYHMLRASLFAQGKDLTTDFVPDADHSFNVIDESDKPVRSEWMDVMSRVLVWFEPSLPTASTKPSSTP